MRARRTACRPKSSNKRATRPGERAHSELRECGKLAAMDPGCTPTATSRLTATALGLLVLVFALVSCSANLGKVETSGHALSAVGLQGSGPLGFDPAAVKVAHEYGFAFPQLMNNSHGPITVKNVRIVSVPDHVQILRYGVLSTKDTDGYILFESEVHSGDDTDYARYPNYPLSDLVIQPGKQSVLYPVVYVRVSGPVSSDLSGCQVSYLQENTIRTQTFYCMFSLNGK